MRTKLGAARDDGLAPAGERLDEGVAVEEAGHPVAWGGFGVGWGLFCQVWGGVWLREFVSTWVMDDTREATSTDAH